MITKGFVAWESSFFFFPLFVFHNFDPCYEFVFIQLCTLLHTKHSYFVYASVECVKFQKETPVHAEV